MKNFNPKRDIPDLSGKVIFITGGTSGIGRASLISLALHNPSHIYFTGRNAKAGSEVVAEVKARAPNCSVTFIQCDLSAPRNVIRQALVENFSSSRLDIFIANAGIMAVPHALGSEGFEVQFATNYIGHAVMLKVLRPVMLRTVDLADGGDVRLLMLSSVGHNLHPKDGIQFDQLKKADAAGRWELYGQSKLADILYSKAMAKRYPQITSVSIHPGLVKSSLSAGVQSTLLNVISTVFAVAYQSPEKGAYNTLWAVATPKNKLVNGLYYEPVGKKAGPAMAWWGQAKIVDDEALADKLWEWTENELKSVEEL